MAAIDSICNLADALQTAVAQVLNFFLLRLTQLKRLAAMLEQLGFLIKLPQLDALLALTQIDQVIYAELRRICPALQLPDYSGGELSKIRNQVANAYRMLSGNLLQHPWSQLGGLQTLVDSVANQATSQLTKLLGGDVNILACLVSLCNSDVAALEARVGAPIANAVKQLSSASAAGIEIDLTGGFNNSSVNLLSPNQKALHAFVGEYSSTLKNLINT